MFREALARFFTLAILLIFLPGLSALAQLKADFAADKTGGCAPLAVSFTNSTTGASAAATYEWNFENGNTSSLKNPGAIFREEKTYTITLTVRDGNQSSSKTASVTVYKKPTVDFSASRQEGCLPLPVTFTSNATAGDGTIAGYFWDFGDGYTQQSTSTQQITHTYTSGQNPSVALTVTNSFGCSNTLVKSHLFTLLPLVKANFDADKTFLCRESDKVTFINSSSGTGSLSYSWNFGDGHTSTEKEPNHAFNRKGAFSVQLAVKSPQGCTDTLVKTAYLNVANFTSDISLPAVICRDGEFELKNTSTPAPTTSTWLVDRSSATIQDYYSRKLITFLAAGPNTIRLANTFGTCTDTITKTFEVKTGPELKGFVAEPGYTICTQQDFRINFRDTTAGAVKWEWNFERTTWPLSAQSTSRTPFFTFSSATNRLVTLWVTDDKGCRSSVEQTVAITKYDIAITTTDGKKNIGCVSLTKKFKAATTEQITSYLWNFGYGATSTEAEPEHTFTRGTYPVKLDYTTAKGCTGTVYYYSAIEVYGKPSVDFSSLSGTTICGNSIVEFKRTQSDYIAFDYYLIDGKYTCCTSYDRMRYQFYEPGKHTVSLVTYNSGCRDTVTKVDYITVLPPFPKISEVNNTCDGNRDVVTFKQTSRLVEKWVWDFGDGSVQSFDTDQPTVAHTYAKTGQYKVVLTAINGQCSVKDSTNAYVLTRQKPLLTSSKISLCGDENLPFMISNLENTSYPYHWVSYHFNQWQYNDGSIQNKTYALFEDFVHPLPYTNGTINRLKPGKDSLRVIVKESYHQCLDTTNFIPIKVTGSSAGFKVVKDQACFSVPVVFEDTSLAYTSPIKTRQWNFGDGQILTLYQGGTVTHTYASPGTYTVTLTTTDAGDCSSSTTGTTVRVYGPKAAFTASASNVPLNTTVYFYNSTNTFGSSNTTYLWDFGDGTTSTGYAPSHTFDKPGTYKVKLTASNMLTGCISEANINIVVQNFVASFNVATSFITPRNCPPVLARFTNTSANAARVSWDFGDGITAENVNTPTHIYRNPGKYIVTLTVYGPNGLTGKYTDSVLIKQPEPAIRADLLHACSSQDITFTTPVKNIASYFWDMGDGTVKQVTDTFYLHRYPRAGVFRPSLMVMDANGCTSSASLDDPIVIDSLYLSLQNLPDKICAPKDVLMQPVVFSISGDQAQQNLQYHWDFGTGKASDASGIKTPSFSYNEPGNYTVSLLVQSPYGCVKEVKKTIAAFQGLGGRITGPAEICQESEAQFYGTTQLAGQPQWQWVFHDGTTVQQQNPPAKKYNNAGTYAVKLRVDNNGCTDEVTAMLQVHAQPDITLSARQVDLCEGASATLTAGGGIAYAWSPATGLTSTSGASVAAAPVVNTRYTVAVTNNYGCTRSDFVNINVVHPLSLQLAPEATICSGSSLQLKASGADAYQWIQNTATLNNTQIANPVVTPSSTTTYTVKGSDKFHCFTDTASVSVVVLPAPTVNAGQSVELVMGAPYQLQPVASSDVVKWNWSPAKYLSCTNCATPEAKPVESMNYKVTVTNQYGCIASDTVSVHLFCSESRVYIPNAFTPNKDGKNDVFSIKGQGVRIIKYFVIYNRWGEVVYERKNFQVDDRSAAWNGTYKGQQVPAGSYVYLLEMSCNEQSFTRKGTITVVY